MKNIYNQDRLNLEPTYPPYVPVCHNIPAYNNYPYINTPAYITLTVSILDTTEYVTTGLNTKIPRVNKLYQVSKTLLFNMSEVTNVENVQYKDIYNLVLKSKFGKNIKRAFSRYNEEKREIISTFKNNPVNRPFPANISIIVNLVEKDNDIYAVLGGIEMCKICDTETYKKMIRR